MTTGRDPLLGLRSLWT